MACKFCFISTIIEENVQNVLVDCTQRFWKCQNSPSNYYFYILGLRTQLHLSFGACSTPQWVKLYSINVYMYLRGGKYAHVFYIGVAYIKYLLEGKYSLIFSSSLTPNWVNIPVTQDQMCTIIFTFLQATSCNPHITKMCAWRRTQIFLDKDLLRSSVFSKIYTIRIGCSILLKAF